MSPTTPTVPRRRDAVATKALLLDAARRRFARDGYNATTVRDIAEDAGVNVSLINRYFTSKEGLFEVCLRGAADELDRAVIKEMTIEHLARRMAAPFAGPESAKHPTQLGLLLRSTGDERAEQIRIDTLRSYAERLAKATGWKPGAANSDRRILAAQLALAAALGIALLRSSTTLEPLTSAGEDDLVGPIHDLLAALLTDGDSATY